MRKFAQMVQGLKVDPAEIARRVYGMQQGEIDLFHAAVGLSAEAGEFLDAIKKVVFYGKELDRTNVLEELGDIEFFMELARAALGITRAEVLAANARKLEARYPEGWALQKSESRDLVTERKALEKGFQTGLKG